MKALTLWNKHLPGLEEALRRCNDPASLVEVAQEVVQNRAQVWGNDKALIITQLYPDGVVHFWLATGEKDEVVRLSHKILAWAKEQGCHTATLTGRRGWVRALRDEGWRETAVLMEKSIDG